MRVRFACSPRSLIHAGGEEPEEDIIWRYRDYAYDYCKEHGKPTIKPRSRLFCHHVIARFALHYAMLAVYLVHCQRITIHHFLALHPPSSPLPIGQVHCIVVLMPV